MENKNKKLHRIEYITKIKTKKQKTKNKTNRKLPPHKLN